MYTKLYAATCLRYRLAPKNNFKTGLNPGKGFDHFLIFVQ